MTAPWEANRVETLAIAMAGAQGVDFTRLEAGGKAYLRRAANGALYRLGGEKASEDVCKGEGFAHLCEALSEVEARVEQHLAGPRGDGEALHVAAAQLRLALDMLRGILIADTPSDDEEGIG